MISKPGSGEISRILQPFVRQFLGAFFLLACAAYVGQTPPGREPSLFAAGFVSTGMGERDVAMTPDGNDVWSEPEVAPFSGQYMDLEPAIAPDGNAFYFMSKRPLPNSGDKMSDENLWMMDRTADGWGKPYPVGPPR